MEIASEQRLSGYDRRGRNTHSHGGAAAIGAVGVVCFSCVTFNIATMRPLTFLSLFACLCSSLLLAQDYPKAEISNGLIHAELMLPDSQNGSYQGTRFDWSGIISSLQFDGHEYFGRWYEHHDPKIHDAITGPVEAFQTNDKGLGYDEAKAGGTFVRIGIGTVRKPEEKDLSSLRHLRDCRPGKVDNPQAQRPNRIHPAPKIRAGIRVHLPEDRAPGERETGAAAGTLVEKYRSESDRDEPVQPQFLCD